MTRTAGFTAFAAVTCLGVALSFGKLDVESLKASTPDVPQDDRLTPAFSWLAKRDDGRLELYLPLFRISSQPRPPYPLGSTERLEMAKIRRSKEKELAIGSMWPATTLCRTGACGQADHR